MHIFNKMYMPKNRGIYIYTHLYLYLQYMYKYILVCVCVYIDIHTCLFFRKNKQTIKYTYIYNFLFQVRTAFTACKQKQNIALSKEV